MISDGSFLTLDDEVFTSAPQNHRRVTALGGGHGLYATLSALKIFTEAITAIVTVADDGGSSGRIRNELGLIPPGDLRMALAALMPKMSTASVYANVLQHRFGGTGALAGHPVGNLLLAGLTEMLGDPVAALTLLGRHFNIIGRVLPMSTIPLQIVAGVSGLEDNPHTKRQIIGQVAVATTVGKVVDVALSPQNVPPCAQALKAINRSEMIVLGPGSWFTSVIPHLLVPEQMAAIVNSPARKVLVLNLVPELGETAGFTAERHLHVLHAHAPSLVLDDVIVDQRSVETNAELQYLTSAATSLGAKVHVCNVADKTNPTIHDPHLLAAVFQELLTQNPVTHGT